MGQHESYTDAGATGDAFGFHHNGTWTGDAHQLVFALDADFGACHDCVGTFERHPNNWNYDSYGRWHTNRYYKEFDSYYDVLDIT